jgi:hypothetical protein
VTANNLELLFPPIGLRLKLDRTVDRLRPCCSNIATVDHGRAHHAAGLRCTQCGRFRGWLPRQGFQFLTDLTRRYGASTEPIVLRDQQIGDRVMPNKQYDDTNHGALFKNTEKEDPKHADYRGEINVNGEQFWLNAWLRTSKKGTKFLSLSVKPKDAAAAKPKPTPDNNMSDEIPF